MLRGRRNTANKYHQCVWGVLAVSWPHWICPRSQIVLFRSTLLRLQVALQGNCLKQALGCVHFPGLICSGSGSQLLHKGADSFGPAFCALPRSEQLRRPGAWRVHTPHVWCILSPPHSQPVGFLGVQQEHHLRCAMCLFWELISGSNPPGGCQPSRIPGRLG